MESTLSIAPFYDGQYLFIATVLSYYYYGRYSYCDSTIVLLWKVFVYRDSTIVLLWKVLVYRDSTIVLLLRTVLVYRDSKGFK